MASGQAGIFLRQVQTLFEVGAVGAMTDAQLLERFLTGRGGAPEAAFEALVERHGPMVLRVCRGVLGNLDDAQDAFQATFLVLALKSRGIGRRELLGNWLYGVATRTAMKARTRAARRRRHELRVAGMTGEALDEDREGGDLALVLHEEVGRLPEKYRSPVVLCHLEGMSYAAAARHLRVTEGTVRGRLARARLLLRDRLERRGHVLASGLLVPPRPQGISAAVPPDLLRSTVRASIGSASSGTSATGLISPKVASLTEGVLRAMLFSRLKAVAWIAPSVGFLAISASLAQQGSDARTPAGPVGRAVTAGASDSPISAAQGSPKQEPGRDGIDKALIRSVEGRIVGSSPITKDCMVLSYLPDWAHGDVDNLGIANNDGGVRTLLSWKAISTEDADSPDRRFLLALYSRKTTSGGAKGPILAFEITEEWPERSSWEGQPAYAQEPAASYEFVPGEGWKLFDVTPLVRPRAVGGEERKGLLLRFLSEDRSGRKQNWSGYQFVSREGSGEWEGRRPMLLVVEKPKK